MGKAQNLKIEYENGRKFFRMHGMVFNGRDNIGNKIVIDGMNYKVVQNIPDTNNNSYQGFH